ncbi:MAG: class I SAM-dependent methyltransferase, partial [Acidobacteriota bacterium]
MTSDKVPFGYRQVTSAEKKRLVREQFDPIAPTYDLADTLLSFGRDSRWRKTAIDLLGLEPGGLVLDACGGTAALARLAARRVGPSGQVVVCDFNRPMMDAGLKKIRSDSGTAAHADSGSGSVSAMAAAAADAETDRGRILFVQGDAEQLSFPDATFDAVTIGFGLRNLVHPERGLAEFLRVLKPGGKLMVLEFSLP